MSKLRIHALSLTVVFENYQKQRTTFVERVAELANQAENIETLQNVGKFKHALPRTLGSLVHEHPSFSDGSPIFNSNKVIDTSKSGVILRNYR